MAKAEKEYISDFKSLLEKENSFQRLYKNKIVKQSSYFNNYASLLLEKGAKQYLDKIKSNKERSSKSYLNPSHRGETTQGNLEVKNFQWEVRETIAMYNGQKSEAQFKLLDYQTPLKNSNKDNEKGIDLVGTDGKDLYILEYKRFKSSESLLRSVLECYSYRRLVNAGIKKFAKDFGFPFADVIPAIIMMKDSNQYKSFIKQDKDSPIIKLMKVLEVKAFLIELEIPFSEDLEMKKILSSTRPVSTFGFDIHEISV